MKEIVGMKGIQSGFSFESFGGGLVVRIWVLVMMASRVLELSMDGEESSFL